MRTRAAARNLTLFLECVQNEGIRQRSTGTKLGATRLRRERIRLSRRARNTRLEMHELDKIQHWARMHVSMFACMHECVHGCVRACMSVFMCVCLSVLVYACMSVCVQISMSICMYVGMCTSYCYSADKGFWTLSDSNLLNVMS